MLLTLRVVSPRKITLQFQLFSPASLIVFICHACASFQQSFTAARISRCCSKHQWRLAERVGLSGDTHWLDPDVENLNETVTLGQVPAWFVSARKAKSSFVRARPRTAARSTASGQEGGYKSLRFELTCWAAQTHCLWNKGIRTEFWQILKSISWWRYFHSECWRPFSIGSTLIRSSTTGSNCEHAAALACLHASVIVDQWCTRVEVVEGPWSLFWP